LAVTKASADTRTPGEIEERYRNLFRRFGHAGLGIVFIAFGIIIWSQSGYLDVPYFFVEFFFLFVGAIFCLLAVASPRALNTTYHSTFVLVALSVLLMLVWLWKVMPSFGTDEIAIEYHAALVMLKGGNPYVSLSNVSVSPYFITPLTTGGQVSSLGYPALSFLLFLPLAAIGVQRPSILLILFSLAPFLFYYYYFRKKNFEFLVPLVFFSLLAFFEYLFYVAGGVTDIIWVTFCLLGVYFVLEDRPIAAGVLLGLAVSTKQLPLFLLPFLAWFAYRQGTSLRKVVVAALAVFAVFNGYFLVSSPSAYFNGILSPESLPLVGIGAGLSQLAFTNVYFLPTWYFTLCVGVVFLYSFGLYVIHYDSLKWGFFVFPAFILLFNFRVLANYVMYWPLFALLIIPYIVTPNSGARRAPRSFSPIPHRRLWTVSSVVLISATLLAGAVVVHGGSNQGITVDEISGVSNPFQIANYITAMNVTVSYQGSQQSIPLYFRIFTNGTIANANGLLWTALGDNTIESGQTRVFQIVPLTSADLLPLHSEYDVVAYYGGRQGSLLATDGGGSTPLLSNPTFSYFDSGTDSVPGWHTVLEGDGSTLGPSLGPAGVTLGISAKQEGIWASAELTQSINLTELASRNLTLGYGLRSDPGFSSEVTDGGWPVQVVGVQVAFNGAAEQIWFGWRPVAATSIYIPGSNLVVVLSNSTHVSFPFALEIANEMHWNAADAELVILMSSQTGNSTAAATFYGLTLTDSLGTG
jgi:uncharacterized membrane protein